MLPPSAAESKSVQAMWLIQRRQVSSRRVPRRSTVEAFPIRCAKTIAEPLCALPSAVADILASRVLHLTDRHDKGGRPVLSSYPRDTCRIRARYDYSERTKAAWPRHQSAASMSAAETVRAKGVRELIESDAIRGRAWQGYSAYGDAAKGAAGQSKQPAGRRDF